MSHLKTYGAGRKKVEAIILKNIQEGMENMKLNHGQPASIIHNLEDIVVNITYSILFNMKIGDREEGKAIVKCVMDVNKLQTFSGFVLNMFPWGRYFGNQAWKTLENLTEERVLLFKKWEEQALKENDENNYINQLYKLKESKYPDVMTRSHILAGTQLLFVGGISTSLGTLSSLFHILVDRPDIQEKLHEEVDAVTAERDVRIEDRNYMPYNMATIYEILRYVPIVPVLASHEALCDTFLGEYNIPKGTRVWCNIWALQHNDNIYVDPFKFQPERFPDDHGQLVPADHPNRVHLLTFGAGPRVCAGETFAMTRMFLILAQMMKAFEFLPPDDGDQEPFDCRNMISGFTLMAHDYRLCLKDRTQ